MLLGFWMLVRKRRQARLTLSCRMQIADMTLARGIKLVLASKLLQPQQSMNHMKSGFIVAKQKKSSRYVIEHSLCNVDSQCHSSMNLFQGARHCLYLIHLVLHIGDIS